MELKLKNIYTKNAKPGDVIFTTSDNAYLICVSKGEYFATNINNGVVSSSRYSSVEELLTKWYTTGDRIIYSDELQLVQI